MSPSIQEDNEGGMRQIAVGFLLCLLYNLVRMVVFLRVARMTNQMLPLWMLIPKAKWIRILLIAKWKIHLLGHWKNLYSNLLAILPLNGPPYQAG